MLSADKRLFQLDQLIIAGTDVKLLRLDGMDAIPRIDPFEEMLLARIVAIFDQIDAA